MNKILTKKIIIFVYFHSTCGHKVPYFHFGAPYKFSYFCAMYSMEILVGNIGSYSTTTTYL